MGGERNLRALDLFCGAGGASMGLHLAGFDVTGVDLHPQPEYPFQFIQADALDVDVSDYDLVWASPPCQRYSAATRQTGRPNEHPDLVSEVRQALATAPAWVIENVPGAPLKSPIMLCGEMFGLGVIRHRLFECSWDQPQPRHVPHRPGGLVEGHYVTVTGNGGVPAWTYKEREARGMPRYFPEEMSLERWQQAMGIDWMSRKALVQAIPPAYAEWLGLQARAWLLTNRRAA